MFRNDRLYRFLFERADVRGEILRLDETARRAVALADYPGPVAALLGEAMVAAGLLVATLKFSGRLILQLQAEGPVTLLLVQVGSDGGMRALARWNGEVPEEGPLEAQARDGRLAMTIEPADGAERYQGIVDLAAGSLSAAIESYFRDSEQLPTLVRLQADGDRTAGLLLQRMPGETEDRDAWNRTRHLAATLTDRELLALEPQEILRRLFHEEDVRLFDPMPFRFRCHCSRDRVASIVRAMGDAEARDLLQEQGRIEVRCDFCGTDYVFDAVDVEQVLAGAGEDTPSRRRH